MSDEKPRSSPLATVAIWLCAVLLLVALYVLSVGPVGWLAVHGMLPGPLSMWEALYKPLEALDGTPLQGPLDAYQNWWTEPPRIRE
jgi:hypothetical protein